MAAGKYNQRKNFFDTICWHISYIKLDIGKSQILQNICRCIMWHLLRCLKFLSVISSTCCTVTCWLSTNLGIIATICSSWITSLQTCPFSPLQFTLQNGKIMWNERHFREQTKHRSKSSKMKMFSICFSAKFKNIPHNVLSFLSSLFHLDCLSFLMSL